MSDMTEEEALKIKRECNIPSEVCSNGNCLASRYLLQGLKIERERAKGLVELLRRGND